MNLTEKGTKVFTSFGSPFINSDNLFIEYNDILRPIGYDLLRALRSSNIINTFLNIEPIQNISNIELFEWYINRDELNIFYNFDRNDLYFNSIEDPYDWLDTFLYKEIDELNIVNNSIKYELYNTLPSVSRFDVIKRVFIYTEKYSSAIERDILENFGTKAKYIYGDFIEVVKNSNLSDSTTFIIADIDKLALLEDNDLLKYTSVLLSDGYFYNFDDEGNPLIDLEELTDNDLFKLFLFNPIDIPEEYETIFLN